jgi:hypothetical protein
MITAQDGSGTALHLLEWKSISRTYYPRPDKIGMMQKWRKWI